jgi:hypothetical protein
VVNHALAFCALVCTFRGLAQQSQGFIALPLLFSERAYAAFIQSAIREGFRERIRRRLGGGKLYTRGQFLHSDPR